MKIKHTIFQKRVSKFWDARNKNHLRWNEQLSIVCEELRKTEDKEYARKLVELRGNMILDYNEDAIEPMPYDELLNVYKFEKDSDIVAFLV